jgi:hypothetical protein
MMIQIIWTDRAKIDYWQNIEYLEREWTLNEVCSFMDKVDHLLVLLTKSNLIFKPTNYESVFEVTVTKHISLFYKLSINKDIELLCFWNTYQNPEKFSL